jgi:integrase/recombinase XerD
MRLDQALDLYVQQLRADGRSECTIKQCQRHVRLLGTWLGCQTHVEEISHEDLARFLNSPEARNRPDGKSKRATSTNALRSSLRTFHSYLHAAGVTTSNPARLIRRARCSPPLPRALSRDEQDRLLAVLAQATGEAGERDRVLFEVMLATGVRVGSALALDVEDVNIDRGELILRTVKGGGSGLVVYFGDRIATLLRGHIGARTSGPLFFSRQTERVSARQVARRLVRWCRAAGMQRPTCCHGLRHSFATNLYRETGDVLLVREALGHRSIASTVVYARPEAARLRALLG